MRIHTAILTLTILVTTFLTFFLTYYLVDMERIDALNDLKNTIDRNDQLLQLVNRSPLYNLDRKSLEVNLESFFTDPNMITIELIEYDGDIHIYQSRKIEAAATDTIKSKVIISRGDIKLGEVRTVYSTGLIEKNLTVARNKHLFFSSVLLISFSFIIYFLIRYFTSPIERLTEAAQLIAAGDLDKKVEKKGAYELATLAESFNSMRNAIKDKIQDLAQQNDTLEQQVAARIQTEAALKSSEKKFTSLFKATPAITTLTTADDIFLDVNDAFNRTTGFSRENVIGKKLEEVDFFLQPEIHLQLKKQLKETGTMQHSDIQVLTKDHQTIDVILFVERISVGDQQLFLNVMLNVTLRKKAEAENIYLRNLLKNTFNSMPSILVGVDYDGIITQWNQHASEITGLNEGEAIGSHFADTLPYPISHENIQHAIDNQTPFKLSKLSTSREEQFYDMTVYPLIEGEAKEAVIRIDDVSERVRIEEMMVQSEKMMSVGGLAAGMAHEINNPLAGIMQNIQVIANRTKPTLRKNLSVAEECGIQIDALNAYLEKREIFSMIDSIMDSSVRAAKIVENMLDFSRKSNSIHVQVDLADLLDQTVELAANDYNLKKNFDFKHIDIVRNYAENLPEVYCDKSKIQQVFLNLLTNGAQAMEHGTINDEPPRFTLTLNQKDKTSVLIEIEDNGPGMDQATAKRIFEPFFTTKSVGKGTGLGLSVSYFIITEDHQGEMEVTTAPLQGARFSITMPLQKKEEEGVS